MNNRQEARHDRHSTKHDIPTDTPLADEKILNTNRAEMQQQFLNRGADTGPTQPPKVTDSNSLRVEELRKKEPVRMNGLASRLDPAHEQEVRGQPELPKIKTEKAIFDERLKEMEQKMEQKMEEKMAALEKKLDERNKKLTEINLSLSRENIELRRELDELKKPPASTPVTNSTVATRPQLQVLPVPLAPPVAPPSVPQMGVPPQPPRSQTPLPQPTSSTSTPLIPSQPPVLPIDPAVLKIDEKNQIIAHTQDAAEVEAEKVKQRKEESYNRSGQRK